MNKTIDKVSNVAVVVAALVVIFVMGLQIGKESMQYEFQSDAVTRGYALFCPNDGEWAWNNECNK